LGFPTRITDLGCFLFDLKNDYPTEIDFDTASLREKYGIYRTGKAVRS
jgi:hypothetical protein